MSADRGKDPIAAELGRRGGIKGGRARAERLPPELRRAIAQRAAAARWQRVHAKPAERPDALPGIPAAASIGTVTVADRALQVARLETGAWLVGQLSVEAALGITLPPDTTTLTYYVAGEWQLKRGLSPETVLDLVLDQARSGNMAAFELLADLAGSGLRQALAASA